MNALSPYFFYTNTINYLLRASKLEQPLHRTTRYGLRTFSYVGSHSWNSVLNNHGDIGHIHFNEYKAFLNTWADSGIFPIYDTSPFIISYVVTVFLCLSCIGYFIASVHVFVILWLYISPLRCIYILPHNCILAFWLMLFVSRAILNNICLIVCYLSSRFNLLRSSDVI